MDKNKPLITIIIPCYEMRGEGVSFLNFSLEKIYSQSYKNIEVLISDQSNNSDIFEAVKAWDKKLNIKYFLNTGSEKSSSSNLNFALKKISEETKYVKYLFQDDFLLNEESIQLTIDSLELNPDKHWLVSSCYHSNNGQDLYYPFEPYFYEDIFLGEPNSISAPSVLTVRREAAIDFDKNLIWLMDVDYYRRLYDEFGEPIILDKHTVVNRTWGGQVGNNVSAETQEIEKNIVTEKFKK
jgi:glycosyltransferase involved in cell wall biosynthesis